MVWFYVDDRFHSHPKVLRAGTAAVGLWVRAGSWSAANLTDGYVPDTALPGLGGTRALAQRLIDAGLWDRLLDGYGFHDWHRWQATRDEIEARSAARRRAGREGGLAKARRAAAKSAAEDARA